MEVIHKKESAYLIYTDVIGSSKIDYLIHSLVGDKKEDREKVEEEKNKILFWRKETFKHQLKSILNSDCNCFVVKSIGDALFIKVTDIPEDREEEKYLCSKILELVFNASKGKVIEIGTSLVPINLRTVVHKVEDYETNLLMAFDDIFSTSNPTQTQKQKCSLFIETLQKDIFGNEVNKAVRIQDLVKGKAILVSDNIVRLFESDKEYIKKLNDYGDIKINQSLYFHSPVPVLHLKGCYDYFQNDNSRLLTIWQLADNNTTGPDKKSTLATEFKSYQAFRMLNCNFKDDSFKNTEIDTDKIISEINSNFFYLENTKKEENQSEKDIYKYFVNKFHNSLIFKIYDFYSLSQIDFTRKDNPSNYNIGTNIKELVIGDIGDKGIKIIKGKQSVLEISFLNETTIEVTKTKITPDNHIKNFIPLLLFTAFPFQKYASFGKKFLQGEITVEGYNRITTQPQTIPVHERINISDYFKGELNKEPDVNSVKLSGKFILVFFGVHNATDDADSDKLFHDINYSNFDSHYKIVAYGLMPGNIDGFILYQIVNKNLDTFKNGEKCTIISRILTKFYKYPSSSVYKHVYPLSLFLLESIKDYSTMKSNIFQLTNNVED